MGTTKIKTQGIYDATYNFRNEDDGETNPTDWTASSSGISIAQVLNSRVGHKKVLDAHQKDDNNVGFTYGSFSEEEYGTVEFYAGSSDTTKMTRMAFFNGGSTYITSLYFDGDTNNKLQYYNGAAFINICDVVPDTWYHLTFCFEHTAGGYDPKGDSDPLAQNKWRIYVNGTKYGDYDFRTNAGLIRMQFWTDEPSTADYYSYFDAFGFTWQSYTVGENLLLEVHTDITSDVVFTKIINEVRQIPQARIRVKGQDFEADDIIQIKDDYTSFKIKKGNYKDSVDFRDDIIGSAPAQTGEGTWNSGSTPLYSATIIDKYNKHSQILQLRGGVGVGHYQATYSFGRDAVDSFPAGWTDLMGAAPPSYSKIVELVGEHGNIFAMYRGAGGGLPNNLQTFTAGNQTNGTVEYWMRTTDTAIQQQLAIDDTGVGDATFLAFRDDKIRYYDGVWQDLDDGPYAASADTWYHIRIDFECGAGGYEGLAAFTWHLYINGEQEGTDLDFRDNVAHVDSIKCTCFNTGHIFYIDAVGYSWDSDYNIGDNEDVVSTIYHDFGDIGSQTSGSIEFWIAMTDPTYECLIQITEDTPTIQIQIRIDDDAFDYDDGDGVGGSTWTELFASPLIGHWYRVVITFDHSTDTYDLEVFDSDGNSEGDVSGAGYTNNGTNCTRIYFYNEDINHITFIDSIGYTWDTTYTLGDNVNLEATLASQTIFEGNIVGEDDEKIQNLDLESLTVELLQAVGDEAVPIVLEADFTPEMLVDMMNEYNHATATEQDEIFRGTYNLLNDSNASIPFGVLDDSEGTGTLEVLTASLGSHKNYIHINHADGNHGAFKMFFEAQTSGTIEWFVRTSNVATGITEMFFYDSGGTVKLKLTIQGSKHKWYDGVALTVGSAAGVNIWYHYRLSFDCTTDTFSTWVDGNTEAVDADFFAVSADIGQLRCEAGHDIGNPSFDSYLDAYGFSWDYRYPEYHTYAIGDNKQLLIDNHEPSDLGAVLNEDISLRGDIPAHIVYNDMTDRELSTWYLLPSDKLVLNLGDEYSGVDLSTCKIISPKGVKRRTRINKVIIKGGFDADPKRVYGIADDLDAQITYGIKIMTGFATECIDEDDLDDLADQLLIKSQNDPHKITLTIQSEDYGYIQVGETIYIPANTIYFKRNDKYIDAGYYIIIRSEYNPINKTTKMTLVDNLILTVSEETIAFIEALVNQ